MRAPLKKHEKCVVYITAMQIINTVINGKLVIMTWLYIRYFQTRLNFLQQLW